MAERIAQQRSRKIYILKKPLLFLRRTPGIRSLRLRQHWAILIGEDGEIWELKRLPNQKIGVKKGNLGDWDVAVKKWPKELIRTTNATDTAIERVGEFTVSRRVVTGHRRSTSTVRQIFEEMKGHRPQNNSILDLEYAVISKVVHRIFRFGDYSTGQNNCQDLVVGVAMALCGEKVDMGSMIKPKSASMFGY